MRRLFDDGHLVEDGTTRSGWRVVDPFLAAWLRDEGESGPPGADTDAEPAGSLVTCLGTSRTG